MFLRPTDHERLRFILRRGLLPWGVVAGVLAAIIGGFGTYRRSRSAPTSVGEALAVAAICFIVWCGVIGWALGAVR